MPKSRFVHAYNKATGRKQRIPRHWLDHPRLGAQWALTPSAKAAEETPKPDDTKATGDQTKATPPPAPAPSPKTSDGKTGSSDKTRN